MSTKKFVYSNEELRQLKPTKNNTSNEEDNTVKAIGSLTFETTYGYISAPLKERRKHEKLSNKHYNKKHKHKNKNYNNNNNNNNEGGGVALIESLKATTNWADDDNEDDDDEEEDDNDEEEEEIIPIDHIQNRWIPPSMRRKIDSDNAKTTTSLENEILNNKANSNEVVVAKAKSTLNKLTVERFDKLSNIFATIVYENEDAVPEIAEVVVLKANAESHFASLYANLCVFICGAENINSNNHLMTEQLQDPKMRAVQLFKKSLLNHCQKLLNVVPDEANDLEYFQKPSPVKAKRDLDDSIDDDNEEALDKIALARKRYYGLVLFVGHLYKTKFLNCFIIHSMISNFLAGTPFLYGSIRPFFLVATCKLLEIVGKRLEYGDDEFKNKNDQGGEIGFNVEDEIEKRHVFNNKWMAFYVEVFNILLEKHDMLKKEVGNGDATDTTTTNVDGIVLYAPRVIFAIRDLIELKQANWEPRKMNTVLKAKSLEQIKADRDAEEVRRKAELLASKLALKQQASHGREVDTDGFETVAVGGRRGRNEGKRLAKAKEYRINKAIAKGRNRHKGGGNNSKSPRHQHNNNNNNYHQQGGGGGGKPPRYNNNNNNNNNNKNTYYNKGRNNNKSNNNSRRRNGDNNGEQIE